MQYANTLKSLLVAVSLAVIAVPAMADRGDKRSYRDDGSSRVDRDHRRGEGRRHDGHHAKRNYRDYRNKHHDYRQHKWSKYNRGHHKGYRYGHGHKYHGYKHWKHNRYYNKHSKHHGHRDYYRSYPSSSFDFIYELAPGASFVYRHYD